MLDITILNAANQEQVVHFDSLADYERSQQACMIGVADHYKVVKVVYKDHQLDYTGNYGDLFFYFLKQDLSQYD
ncbi:DUF4649 family protein [Streptococcus caprae]|uniref:DUF4649 family protein n=1 Tax=Streptococcus caprae TaxID=1640501 RepID=A0ABV8CX63_9STRE